MQIVAVLALAVLALVGCSSGATGEGFVVDPPEVDAGGDVHTPPTPSADGAVMPPPPPKVDAGTDAGADTGATPTHDAGQAIDATPEAAAPEASSPEAAPPVVDAGTDAAKIDATPTADAAPPAIDANDAGGVEPVCTSTSAACQRAIETDALIRATFPQPCTPEGDRKCGGVFRGVVETLPIVCRSGMWRLAGSWSGSQWVAGHSCSMGCGAAGKICDP